MKDRMEENKEYLRIIIGFNIRNQIDWKNSVGKEIEYEYDWKGECSKGVLKIRKYENRYIYFEGYEKGIDRCNLIKCKLGGVLGFKSLEFKCEIGTTMNCLTIIDRDYRYDKERDRDWKYYKYRCGICEHEDWIREDSLLNGCGCNTCGDGVSYPEKLMESVLTQLGIKYERQYRTDWSQNKVYDFYLPDYNTIIETHGIQHYEESNRGRSLKEEQKNDKLKEELALKNKIKHYIIIDCRESNLQYIRLNILDSKLNELLNLNKVDWIKCGKYASGNLVKEVCNRYNMGISIKDLTKEFYISKRTITRYLNKGNELGWCKYDGKEEMRRNGKRNAKKYLNKIN